MDDLPAHLAELPTGEFMDLLDFANEVQAWSLDQEGEVTFGAAAAQFRVAPERIEDAVSAHYWMFTFDADRPLAARRIEHEGE